MLCPYYIKRKEKVLHCNCPEKRIKFESKEELERFMFHHCYLASPINCGKYMEHRKKVEEGEEEPLKPRESMDKKTRNYHTEWTRNRRKDPTYKY